MILLAAACWLALPSAASEVSDYAETAEHTVDTDLDRRLRNRGFQPGAAAFLRVFKETSELQVWLAKAGRFALFETYHICKWSGVIGPKLEEGDKQSPEGIYAISRSDLIVNTRWHRAMDVNYPNRHDQALGRTGSGILIHGKCSSIGCFALRDDDVEEVFTLVEAALDAGQPRVLVHAFPFPLTRANLEKQTGHEWIEFWQSLRPAYTAFERDRLPPMAMFCQDRYGFKAWQRRGKSQHGAGVQGCVPLDNPAPALFASARRNTPGESGVTMVSLSPAERAKNCNPRQTLCRMLRIALTSNAPCPKKYARCRNRDIAAIKSVDCPLKYPRCRKRGAARPRLSATLTPANAKRR